MTVDIGGVSLKIIVKNRLVVVGLCDGGIEVKAALSPDDALKVGHAIKSASYYAEETSKYASDVAVKLESLTKY